MSWVKIDDQFYDHPKTVKAGRDGRDLFIAGLCHCAAQLTDGFIDADLLPLIAFKAGVTAFEDAVVRLVAVGFWEECSGGFQVHDYLDYNPSAEKVRSERQAAKDRMTRRRRPEDAPNQSPCSQDILANDEACSGEVRANFAPRSPSPVPVPVPPGISTTPQGGKPHVPGCAREGGAGDVDGGEGAEGPETPDAPERTDADAPPVPGAPGAPGPGAPGALGVASEAVSDPFDGRQGWQKADTHRRQQQGRRDQPLRDLFAAFRRAKMPHKPREWHEGGYTPAELNAALPHLRAMHREGVTPEQVESTTRRVLSRLSRADMVTVKAVAERWSEWQEDEPTASAAAPPPGPAGASRTAPTTALTPPAPPSPGDRPAAEYARGWTRAHQPVNTPANTPANQPGLFGPGGKDPATDAFLGDAGPAGQAGREARP